VCVIVGIAGAVAGALVGIVAGAIAGATPGLGQVLLGGIIGLFARDNGSFKDVENDPESGNIEEDDCVFVFGDQVYDGGHTDGWLEIHPVKHFQLVCNHVEFDKNADSNDPNCCPGAPTDSPTFKSAQFKADVKAFWDRWCNAIATSRDP